MLRQCLRRIVVAPQSRRSIKTTLSPEWARDELRRTSMPKPRREREPGTGRKRPSAARLSLIHI